MRMPAGSVHFMPLRHRSSKASAEGAEKNFVGAVGDFDRSVRAGSLSDFAGALALARISLQSSRGPQISPGRALVREPPGSALRAA